MTDFTAYIGEPDWAAAACEIGAIVRGMLQHPKPMKHDGVDTELEGHWAGRVVGAALAGMETVTLSEEIRECTDFDYAGANFLDGPDERRLVGRWELVDEEEK